MMRDMDRDSQNLIEDEVVYEEYVGRRDKRKRSSNTKTNHSINDTSSKDSTSLSRSLFQVFPIAVSYVPVTCFKYC
jgi:hypothetical protein